MKVLYEQQQFPVLQNRVYETAQDAINCLKGDIKIIEDAKTGLVYNAAFNQDLIIYDEHYNNEQGLCPSFKQYLQQSAELIEGSLGKEVLVEVGCGKGFFLNNPFDGHTLAEQFEQATILMQDTGLTPQTVYVDRGYWLKKEDRLPIRTLLPDMKRQMTKEKRKLASRRQAIEPIIGHLKSDHRLDRCYLKGQTGEAIHAVLCAAGYKIKWLMRRILQKGIKPFFAPLFCTRTISLD